MKNSYRSLLFFFWLLAFSTFSQAQPLQAVWGANSGCDTLCNARYSNIAAFSDGSVCQLGWFRGSSYSVGDSTFIRRGQSDIYVAEYSPDGIVEWAYHLYSEDQDLYFYPNSYRIEGHDILNIAISAGRSVTLGDSTVSVPNSMHGFTVLLQIDRNGHILTFRTLLPDDNTAEIYLNSVAWNNRGSMVVAGSYEYGSIHSGGITLPAGQGGEPCSFVFRYDAELTTQWGEKSSIHKKGMESRIGNIYVSSLYLAEDNSVAMLGNFIADSASLIFGDDTLPIPEHVDMETTIPEVFVVRYDETGQYSWSVSGRLSSKPDVPSFRELKGLSTGEIIVTGTNNEVPFTLGKLTLDFSTVEPDGFIYEISSAGTIRWGFVLPLAGTKKNHTTLAGLSSELGEVVTDVKDNIYLSGVFKDNILVFPNGGDTLYLNGHSQNQFLVKYGPDGNFIWSQPITSGNSTAPAITINDKGYVYVSSETAHTLYFDDDSLVHDTGSEWRMFVVGFDTTGRVTYKTLVVNEENNKSMRPVALTANSQGDLFIFGSSDGNHTIGSLYLQQEYNDNSFLIRLSPVAATSVLQGYVLTSEGTGVAPGWVKLYQMKISGPATVVDSVFLQDDGSYFFQDVPQGMYLVYAFADTNAYPNSIGTYYGDKVLWSEADTIRLNGDTLFDRNIQIIQIVRQLDGTATMKGNISYGSPPDQKSLSTITGEPVKKVKVILIKKDKASDNNIVAWVYTDDQGNFVFENVPDGTYSLIVDIPGLPMDSTYTVTVKDNIITGLDFIVTDKEIYVATPTGFSQPAASVSGMKVWPVPATGTVTVRTGGMTGGTLTLFNTGGKTVMTFSLDRPEMTLDLSALPDGLYYLQAVSNRQMKTAKVILKR